MRSTYQFATYPFLESVRRCKWRSGELALEILRILLIQFSSPVRRPHPANCGEQVSSLVRHTLKGGEVARPTLDSSESKTECARRKPAVGSDHG